MLRSGEPVNVTALQTTSPSPADCESSEAEPHRGYILLVEDEPATAERTGEYLCSAGYDVTVASTIAGALQALKGISFDLMLLDVQLGDGNGIQLLQALAESPDAPKVVVMTASSTSDTVLKAIRYRAQDFIRKPCHRADLLDVVSRAAQAAREEIEVISCTPEWLELVAPCTRESAARIEGFVTELAADLPTEVRAQVAQVFRELLLNAVEWGGGLNPNHRVRVAYVRGKRSVQYRIADPGPGFSFRDLAHSAMNNEASDPLHHAKVRESKGLRPGGLGILMARAMADELIYNERQNEVLFIKYLSVPSGP